MNMTARGQAARVVAAVAGGASLSDALSAAARETVPGDAPLLKAIVYGVVRERRLLEWFASRLLQKPLKNEPELQALLLCGLYQLRSMRVAAHAAVGETVAATETLRKPWAKGLVNAVLRRFQREQAALEAAVPDNLALKLSYPDWLVTAIRRDWQGKADAVLAAGNVAGPMTLRVNRRRGDRDAYLQRLTEAGIAADAIPGVADAVRLIEARGVEDVPGFDAGLVSVQDASAQIAADLLDAQNGQRVLDACAAPGGKTAHLLERHDNLDLLALDSDGARLERIGENLNRLGLNATLRVADATTIESWWDGRRFDRILLDAPCSGTGVIRRHPDIKWLRRERDIANMATLQRRLLEALWRTLAPNGVLVYATCSILRAEGTEVVERFLAATADAVEWPIADDWGEAEQAGRRIAPGDAFDGFYYARLRKIAN
jgi:16S rRNA (cytosine967-C5)-methyltransferase